MTQNPNGTSANLERKRPRYTKDSTAKLLNKRNSPPIRALAIELFWSVSSALRFYGLNKEEIRQCAERAEKVRKPPIASARAVREYRAVGNLVFKWMCDPRYIDDLGKPKVLPILGNGCTFASLARQFFPKTKVTAVAKLACDSADIEIRPRNRIALYGGCAIDVAKSQEAVLAHSIRHVVQLLNTSQHNLGVVRRGRGVRWTERMVNRVIDKRNWSGVLAEIRPQLADLIERTDLALQPREQSALKSRRKKSVVGVGLYVFRDDAVDRTGVENRGI